MEDLIIRIFEEFRKENLQVNLNEQQLKNLIDVALFLGDKEWFLELSMRLKAVSR